MDPVSAEHAGDRWRPRGFTLLEVLVAVAILGLGLTAILSAQAGAVSSATHARNISVATGLARCKMSELEEKLGKDGFQELDEHGAGPCCGDTEQPHMGCAWSIEKPLFPEQDTATLQLDAGLGSMELGPIGALAKSGQGQEIFSPDAGLGGVAEALTGGGDLSGAASAGMGGLSAMVMSMVYPDLKVLFETATRRVTVVLTWTEGTRSYDIRLVQWIASPRAAGLVGAVPGDLGDLSAAAPAGSAAPAPSGRTGTGPTPAGGTKR
ncbi:MAG: prepilin-type N-terminal cleavage/methylation domain-containing protein [Deltaproteobacteria bacterium]|nr:prepilin-type N-terminal cleavage/methylation domain-containing protein [Deltaproteobacteria bacterium]